VQEHRGTAVRSLAAPSHHAAAPDHVITHRSGTDAAPAGERPEADWNGHVTGDGYNRR
jgi:hypothetical protein